MVFPTFRVYAALQTTDAQSIALLNFVEKLLHGAAQKYSAEATPLLGLN
jgi:hypothetical protein